MPSSVKATSPIMKTLLAVGSLVALFVAYELLWGLALYSNLLRFAINTPMLTGVIAGVALVSMSFYGAQRRDGQPKKGFRLVAGSVLVLGGLIGMLVGNPLRKSAWAKGYEATLTRTLTAPDSNFLPRRVLPEAVADQFARGLQTDARFVYESIHPTVSTSKGTEGRLVWQTAASPNSITTYFTNGVTMIAEVDADTTSPQVVEHQVNLPAGGENNYNSFAHIINRSIDPLAEVMPPVYDIARREAIVPLVHWVWGIPALKGVVVFDSTGQTSTMTVAAAGQRYPHLRLYPESLVRWEAETWGSWRSGFVGHFTKNGLYALAETPGSTPPTLLDDAARALWVVSLEPMGRSFGLAGILFIDPSTGKRTFWDTKDAGYMSPSRATQVAESDPRISFMKNAEAFEPKLAIRNGHVSFLVPVGPSNGSQVQTLVLVDGKSRAVVVAPTVSLLFNPVSTSAASVTGEGAGTTGGSVAAQLASLRAQMVETLRQFDALATEVAKTTP